MYQIKEVLLDKERELQIEFLQTHNLEYEYDIDYSILVYDGDEIIATGSISNNIMKDFAVKKEYSGQNITGLMFKHLVQVLQSKNIYHFFVFTKPENEQIFLSLNMKRIVQTMNTVLLEGGDTIDHVLGELKKEYHLSDNKKACVIINANPMTKGHLYLVEKASKENEEVLVFVVSENLSSFPFEDRFNIIKEATKDLENVTVLPTLNYLVSRVTFPRYFLKDETLISDEQTLVDVLVYKQYYTKIFNIKKRYVGTEPLSPTTNKYNKVMKDYLGTHLNIVDRIFEDKDVVSASLVRKLIRDNKISEIEKFVPKATFDYLLSEKGQRVIKEIQEKEFSRH
jgi:[citrate (pro-3S)-lyase] ligase